MKIWVIAAVLAAALASFVWATDFVTLQGERTIYLARCDGGTWVAERCTGKTRPGERYRFRALKNKHEVFYWTVGSGEPSGKLAPCEIKDGRNWSCASNTDAARSIIVEMHRGHPVERPASDGIPLHAVSKWEWYLLRYAPGG